MKRIALIAAAVLMTAAVACKNNAKTPSGWKTIERPGYTIGYPDSLRIEDSGVMGAEFYLFFPPDNFPADYLGDEFRENINLLAQDLTGLEMSLDDYVQLSENQVRTLFTDGAVLESRREKKNGSEFHKIVYTGKQGQYSLQFEQLYTIKNNTAYVLTFTATMVEFERYRPAAEEIMDSFRLK